MALVIPRQGQKIHDDPPLVIGWHVAGRKYGKTQKCRRCGYMLLDYRRTNIEGRYYAPGDEVFTADTDVSTKQFDCPSVEAMMEIASPCGS